MATTGWSGLYNREYTDLPSGLGSLTVNKYPQRNRIKRLVNREGFRAFTELFDTLIGAASGGAASATHKRIAAVVRTNGPQGGGNRTIETITDISRNSTAGDVTALKEMVFGVRHQPTTYVNNTAINPR